MTTCLVADDQEMVREGFSALLNAQPDLTVVAGAANGVEAVTLCDELRPDVVLMDVRMPVMDGLEATRKILSRPIGESPTRVLILTTFDLDDYVYEARRAGASGFLLKDAPAAELVNAVRVIAAGDALLAPSITRRLIEDFVSQQSIDHSPTPSIQLLTPRENEVLRLIARGLSTLKSASISSLRNKRRRHTSVTSCRNWVSAIAFRPSSWRMSQGS